VPRANRTPKPIESFGPEVLQGLIEGSKRELILELPYRKAVFFRQRANALRAEMRRQNHDLYRVVSQATLRIVWGTEAGYDETPERKSQTNVRFPINKNTPAKLIITPADKEFGEALEKAGVKLPPVPVDPVPNTEGPDTGTDILESYLKEEPHAAD
jgi:hypothetical protein